MSLIQLPSSSTSGSVQEPAEGVRQEVGLDTFLVIRSAPSAEASPASEATC